MYRNNSPEAKKSQKWDLLHSKVEPLGYLYMLSKSAACHGVYVKVRVENREIQGLNESKCLSRAFRSSNPKLSK